MISYLDTVNDTGRLSFFSVTFVPRELYLDVRFLNALINTRLVTLLILKKTEIQENLEGIICCCVHLQEIRNYYCSKKVVLYVSVGVVIVLMRSMECGLLLILLCWFQSEEVVVWDAAVWTGFSGLLFVGYSWCVLFSFSETKLSQAVCFVLIPIPGGSHYQSSNLSLGKHSVCLIHLRINKNKIVFCCSIPPPPPLPLSLIFILKIIHKLKSSWNKTYFGWKEEEFSKHIQRCSVLQVLLYDENEQILWRFFLYHSDTHSQ